MRKNATQHVGEKLYIAVSLSLSLSVSLFVYIYIAPCRDILRPALELADETVRRNCVPLKRIPGLRISRIHRQTEKPADVTAQGGRGGGGTNAQ